MNLISRFRKVHDADFGFFYPVSRLVPKTMTAGFEPVKKLPSEAIGSNLKRVSLISIYIFKSYPVARLVPKTMTAGFEPVKKLPSEAIGSNLKRVSLISIYIFKSYPVARLVPKTMTAGFEPVKKLHSEAIGSNLKRVSLHVTLSVQLENITFCVLITRRSDVFLELDLDIQFLNLSLQFEVCL